MQADTNKRLYKVVYSFPNQENVTQWVNESTLIRFISDDAYFGETGAATLHTIIKKDMSEVKK